ncbi:MAG: enoyl-CoA hydratase-related protein [Actinomycetota bacterium]
MSYATILTELVDGILVIAMNRPDRLNAWTPEMGGELADAIAGGNANDDVMAMVLTGMGKGFCAGADIGEVFQSRAEAEPPPVDSNATVEAPLDPLVDDADFGAGSEPDESPSTVSVPAYNWIELIRGSKPIVAAVNGAAVGVGLTQILPMDCIVAARGAKLSVRFIKMGLVPELASSHFLPMRVGFGAASDLMLTGRIVLAEEALDMGLVDKLADPDELLKVAAATAKAMGENPPSALLMVKELLTENMTETSLHEVQRREMRALETAYETHEHHEAIDAFMNNREPDFRSARS